ncbi:8-oxo-dGTP diphosphatase MutT [Paraferrimonas sp. SM1919]|uniref:8-oxo-dGTP diphosphatase MutT n=1 Tax=Paraferrimonas sp. SM1919 TaxID=2662263 RepID=UPI0013D5988D|nr:8-oxo-dGTP diphosphatase MutT [Paraferrimonas sp. SM1919]
MNYIDVAVGLITRNDQVFLTRRKEHQHQGNKWEFPGGKIEKGELPIAGLARELAEEVDIKVNSAQQVDLIEHDYGDKCVRLFVFEVANFSGEPRGAEGQQSTWVKISQLQDYPLPEANQAMVDWLQSCLKKSGS